MPAPSAIITRSTLRDSVAREVTAVGTCRRNWKWAARRQRTGCPCSNYDTDLAASRITSSTTLGWESMGTWLDATSVTLAPMRFAAKRSKSGWTVRSWVATMDQLGFDRHAMPPSYFWVNRSAAGAKWVDHTTPCSSGVRSPAK